MDIMEEVARINRKDSSTPNKNYTIPMTLYTFLDETLHIPR